MTKLILAALLLAMTSYAGHVTKERDMYRRNANVMEAMFMYDCTTKDEFDAIECEDMMRDFEEGRQK